MHLIDLVRQRGSGLPYANVLIADLEGNLETAGGTWREAQVELGKLQELQSTLRDHGNALRDGLVKQRTGADEDDEGDVAPDAGSHETRSSGDGASLGEGAPALTPKPQ